MICTLIAVSHSPHGSSQLSQQNQNCVINKNVSPLDEGMHFVIISMASYVDTLFLLAMSFIFMCGV